MCSALLPEMSAHPEWCGLHDDISRSDAEIEPRKSCFDLRNECLKQPNITVILPSGCHGRPSGSDSKGPSPLIKRWREGGKCDCKGWDLGCGMMVLTDQQPKFSPGMDSSRLGFYKNDGKHLALYKQVQNFPFWSFSVYALSFLKNGGVDPNMEHVTDG